MPTQRSSALMNFLAFVALIFIALSLLLSEVLNPSDITRALYTIATVLAVIIVAFYAFYYTTRYRRNKNIWPLVAWTAAVAVIVLAYLLNWLR